MSKHTELPWKMNLDGDILLPDGKVIRLVNCTYANVEFILLACNAHKDLLAACKQSLFIIKCLRDYQHDIVEELRKVFPRLGPSTHDNPPLESIQAAIAAATP